MVTTCGQLTRLRHRGHKDHLQGPYFPPTENSSDAATLISHAWAEYQDQSNDSDHAEHPHPTGAPPSHTITVHGAFFGIAHTLFVNRRVAFLGHVHGSRHHRHAFVHRLHVVCHRLQVINYRLL